MQFIPLVKPDNNIIRSCKTIRMSAINICQSHATNSRPQACFAIKIHKLAIPICVSEDDVQLDRCTV